MILYYYNCLFSIIIFVFSIRTQSNKCNRKKQILKKTNAKKQQKRFKHVLNRNVFLGANTNKNILWNHFSR